MLPQARDVVQVTYSLYVRHVTDDDVSTPNDAFKSVNVSGPHTMAYSLRQNRRWKSLLSNTRPTKIITHDYRGSGKWMHDIIVMARIETSLLLLECRDGLGIKVLNG